MNNRIAWIYSWLFGLAFLLLQSCVKYDTRTNIPQSAYLRVYNNIPYSKDFLHKDQIMPFLTFLFDPEMDKDGVPQNAAIIGDFLGTRQLYSASYPLNAGNVGHGNNTTGGASIINYDYPGNASVQTAPPINGLDLSAWAQIPSGRHRIVFVVRPFTDTPFLKLPARFRKNVLVDTTIEFKEGEVYTMETIVKDLELGEYGLYLRQESFIHQSFDDNKHYVSFYNLTGNPVTSNPTRFFKQYYAKDNIRISYTYRMYDEISSVPGVIEYYRVIQPYNDLFVAALTGRFQTRAPFVALPGLPKEYFYTQSGTLKTHGQLGAPGSMPYISFRLLDEAGNMLKGDDGGNASIYCNYDPATINSYNQGATTSNGIDAPVCTANLNMVSAADGKSQVSTSINIFELVYDRVYHIQLQRLAQAPPR